MEKLDVYNADRQKIRVINRGEQLLEGEYALAVFAYIKNSKDEFLITKRSPAKKHFPNMWEVPHGCAQSGESPLDGCIRETQEECGIILSKEKARLVSTFRNEKSQLIGEKFLFIQNLELSSLVLDRGEVADAKFANINEISEMNTLGIIQDYIYNDVLQIINSLR